MLKFKKSVYSNRVLFCLEFAYNAMTTITSKCVFSFELFHLLFVYMCCFNIINSVAEFFFSYCFRPRITRYYVLSEA